MFWTINDFQNNQMQLSARDFWNSVWMCRWEACLEIRAVFITSCHLGILCEIGAQILVIIHSLRNSALCDYSVVWMGEKIVIQSNSAASQTYFECVQWPLSWTKPYLLINHALGEPCLQGGKKLKTSSNVSLSNYLNGSASDDVISFNSVKSKFFSSVLSRTDELQLQIWCLFEKVGVKKSSMVQMTFKSSFRDI